MTYLGIDYGENHLGLAISNGILAQPYNLSKAKSEELKSKNQNVKLETIKEILTKENINKVIIGFSEGKIAEEIKDFGEKLRKEVSLPIEYQDETLTSQEAVKKMIEAGRGKKYRKVNEHNIAACLILQSYLDSLSFKS